MADSIQHRIGRNRPPRVQITYDVEIGNAIEKKEIPFVVGILADLQGPGTAESAAGAAPPLKDPSRKFVEIDRDNFAHLLAEIKPSLTVANKHNVVIESMDDFNPANLVQRVDALKTLYQRRAGLRDLLTKLDSNDNLHAKLSALYESGKISELADEAAKAVGDHDARNKVDAGSGEGQPAGA